MFSWLRHLFGWILSALGSRKDLVLENVALREQLLALQQASTSPTIASAQAVLGCLEELLTSTDYSKDFHRKIFGPALDFLVFWAFSISRGSDFRAVPLARSVSYPLESAGWSNTRTEQPRFTRYPRRFHTSAIMTHKPVIHSNLDSRRP
jgi:hypothetical protein